MHPLIRSLLCENTTSNEKPRLQITYARDFLATAGVTLPDQTTSGYGVAGHEYWMYDHGLFVAGIIHTIAREAQLHLIEVLNWFGVGTLETIARGLEFARVSRKNTYTPLIVN